MPFLRRIDAALLVGSGAIAGIAFHRVFDPGAVIEVVVWSVLAAAVVSVAAQRLQLGLATGVLLHAACFVVTGSAVLFRRDRLAGVIPTMRAMGSVWHRMIGGWADVLAVPAPSRGAPTDLVIVALVAWFACAGALELRWRTTSLTAPLAPPVIAFGVALPFAVGGPGTNGPLAIALAVSALGFIAARKTGLRPSEETADNETQPVERRSPGRSVARATVFLSALTVAIGSLVVALPVSATAYNPRADRRDPVRPAAEVNPLSSIRRLLTDDRDTELFVVTSDHPIPTDSYWRLATLDRYDDDMWQPGPDPFGPTGSRLTKPTGSSASRARYTFVIRGLTGELLPVPPAVSTVEQASLRYQQTGQTLLDPRGVSASESYAVTADPAPTVTADALANAVIPATMPTNANRDPSHACIEALAAALSAGKTQPSEQLSAFQSFLQDPTLFTDNPAAAHSGHGLSELIDLVRPAIAHVGSTSPALNNDCAVAGPTDVPVPVAGTDEQFASIFVLRARSVALPAS